MSTVLRFYFVDLVPVSLLSVVLTVFTVLCAFRYVFSFQHLPVIGFSGSVKYLNIPQWIQLNNQAVHGKLTITAMLYYFIAPANDSLTVFLF
jgi:hypothetical protein